MSAFSWWWWPCKKACQPAPSWVVLIFQWDSSYQARLHAFYLKWFYTPKIKLTEEQYVCQHSLNLFDIMTIWVKQAYKHTHELREAIIQKILFFMKYFHRTVTPPYCIYEILFQIFYRKFRDKIEIRHNSVSHHQSHPKFKFSIILVQWTPKIWGKLPLDE